MFQAACCMLYVHWESCGEMHKWPFDSFIDRNKWPTPYQCCWSSLQCTCKIPFMCCGCVCNSPYTTLTYQNWERTFTVLWLSRNKRLNCTNFLTKWFSDPSDTLLHGHCGIQQSLVTGQSKLYRSHHTHAAGLWYGYGNKLLIMIHKTVINLWPISAN